MTYAPYTPIDEWLESPRVRILRALRWFPDGITAEDLGDALDVPRPLGAERSHERCALSTALRRLVASGDVVELPRCRHSAVRYRLAPGVRVVAPNDEAVRA